MAIAYIVPVLEESANFTSFSRQVQIWDTCESLHVVSFDNVSLVREQKVVKPN